MTPKCFQKHTECTQLFTFLFSDMSLASKIMLYENISLEIKRSSGPLKI